MPSRAAEVGLVGRISARRFLRRPKSSCRRPKSVSASFRTARAHQPGHADDLSLANIERMPCFLSASGSSERRARQRAPVVRRLPRRRGACDGKNCFNSRPDHPATTSRFVRNFFTLQIARVAASRRTTTRSLSTRISLQPMRNVEHAGRRRAFRPRMTSNSRSVRDRGQARSRFVENDIARLGAQGPSDFDPLPFDRARALRTGVVGAQSRPSHA